MPEQDTDKMGLLYAKQFYKHALRTLGYALGAFGFVGGAITTILWAVPDGTDPAFAVVTFLAWGSIAAAVVLVTRKPPF